MDLVRYSYTAVALGYLAFVLLSALSWRGRAIGGRLIVAGSASAAWAVVIALATSGKLGGWVFPALFMAETLRDVAWLWFLLAVAHDVLPVLFRRILAVAGWLAVILSLGWWSWPLLVKAGFTPVRLLSISGFVLTFCGLVILEQLYRNAHADAQSALRYLILGLGGLFAFDLFMYAQAELLRGFSTAEWTIRAALNLLALPCVAIATRRSAEWSVDIFISRQVVFYSTAFTVVGLYLLSMALGGYYIRAVGGTWGAAVQLVFLVGAGFALLALIFSISLRRRAKVFIAKHFYRNKYDYRIEWLKFINTLSVMGSHDERQVAVKSIAQVFGSAAGLLFMRDESGKRFGPEGRWCVEQESGNHFPRVEHDIEGISASEGWIELMATRHWIVDLDEYRRSPDAYGNIYLPEWLLAGSRWRVVSPLFQLDQLVGFVVLAAPPPPFDLTYEDIDLLRTLGRHVSTYLAQHAAARKLREVGQFEAVNRLTAFMMHDLKNAVAQMSLVVRNAEKHKRNPDFIDDAIGTIANATARIERLIEQLRQGASGDMRQRVLLERVIDRAMSARAVDEPVPVAHFVDEDLWVDADFERLSAVIGHLIRNAQEATPASGDVTVSLERHDAQAWVIVQDSGAGMDDAFIRERLFKPFDSTKGTRGMGIGAYQAREYVQAIGGDLQVQSVLGHGTIMTIRLPLAHDAQTAAHDETGTSARR